MIDTPVESGLLPNGVMLGNLPHSHPAAWGPTSVFQSAETYRDRPAARTFGGQEVSIAGPATSIECPLLKHANSTPDAGGHEAPVTGPQGSSDPGQRTRFK
jgi:hypothetical protein